MIFSFLKQDIARLAAALGRTVPSMYFYVSRCAYVMERPTFKKGYKFMASGDWFKPAVRKCSCTGVHLDLMETLELPDGRIQVNGTTDLKESGLYPPALGESIVLAWLANGQSTDPALLRRQHSLPAVPTARAVQKKPAVQPVQAVRTVQAVQPDNDDLDDDPWSDSQPVEVPQAKKAMKKKKAMKVMKKKAMKAMKKKVKQTKKKPSVRKPAAAQKATPALEEGFDSDPWA